MTSLVFETFRRSITPQVELGYADWLRSEFYLHDGRATSLDEAVLLHGGEAQAARDGFVALSSTERDAVVAFLKSL